jgi:hypothetical protein
LEADPAKIFSREAAVCDASVAANSKWKDEKLEEQSRLRLVFAQSRSFGSRRVA